METIWISHVVSMNCSCQFITLLSVMCMVILPLPLASHPDIENIRFYDRGVFVSCFR